MQRVVLGKRMAWAAMMLVSSISTVGYLENWADRPEFSAAKVGFVRLFGNAVAPAKEATPTNAAAGRIVALRAGDDGHFRADASVNGRRLAMLVDTGATNIVLSAEDAERVGVRPRASDYVVPISTANGKISAAAVLIDEVRVGPIGIRSVPALVLKPGLLDHSLLGMSFFSRLRQFEMRGRELVLRD